MQRVQMTAGLLILQRQSKYDLDISFCWNVGRSFRLLTTDKRRKGKPKQSVPRAKYTVFIWRVNHVTLIQLNEWWKAAVCAGCLRVCNNTVKCVFTWGVWVVGKARLCARVRVCVCQWLSESVIIPLCPLAPLPITSHLPSGLPLAGRLLLRPLFQPPFFLFTLTFFCHFQ